MGMTGCKGKGEFLNSRGRDRGGGLWTGLGVSTSAFWESRNNADLSLTQQKKREPLKAKEVLGVAGMFSSQEGSAA